MNRKWIVAGIAVGVLLFAAGFLVRGITDKSNSSGSDAQASQEAERYPLLARRIFVENPNESIINFEPLRESMNNYFNENGLEGSAYFEYLPTGTSIRISGEEELVAASLFKLPAAMDLYKSAEKGGVDLDKKIELQPEWLDPGFGNLYRRGVGYELSIREAAETMLKDSDNTALKAVASSTGELNLDDRSFSAVDVSFTQNQDLTVSISARSYSSFLKCLYFSCYNIPDHSNEILRYLTESDFDQRIVAGIDDKDITVAHKIGVNSETIQSDCGIVYLPQRNYIFCAMLRGQNDETTDKHIAELSKLAYEYLKPQD